ncbi:hypothetical protein [Aphanizomenon sp. CS-733/32]|nr:hypothetical protein [Aphanizomenon sp. CS-733/32]
MEDLESLVYLRRFVLVIAGVKESGVRSQESGVRSQESANYLPITNDQ